ncbi:hypothetical protein GCM10007049_30590 [Echinicola pacifica]|uniref:Lipopolysaccharide kinase (Kdo/WaaP) family protein n=1 Tax=Echinicola pacifica TaxID=346377 RepID=A0A918UUJ0_9BACT|nr:lipopolysaccharide kinase InaA family protein [Echinicola pacifica]GGZ35059.1 hypothetical protein GCM10007049_30590 [Echinicola pacifica]
MKVDLVINPKYHYLEEYIKSIPQTFDHKGQLIYDLRNHVRVDQVSGARLVIKSYRKIYLANRLIYNFLRPTKSKRAYSYGFALQQRGINTPEPIAYIDYYRFGQLKGGYFISLFSDYEPLTHFNLEQMDHTVQMLDALAVFIHRLHQNGVFHEDFTLNNILYKEEDGQFDFMVIDNNRLKLRKVSMRDAMKNLNRLNLNPEMMTYLIRKYSEANGLDTLKELKLYYDFKYEKSLQGKVKQRLKQYKRLIGG